MELVPGGSLGKVPGGKTDSLGGTRKGERLITQGPTAARRGKGSNPWAGDLTVKPGSDFGAMPGATGPGIWGESGPDGDRAKGALRRGAGGARRQSSDTGGLPYGPEVRRAG